MLLPLTVGWVQEAIRVGGHAERVNTAAFSPTGELLASGGEDGTIRIWNVATGAEVAVWENMLPDYAHSYPVYVVRFSHSGNTVISGGNDYAVKIWRLDGRILQVLREHYCVTAIDISSDGRVVVSGSKDCLNMDSTIKIWDVSGGKEVRRLNGDYSGVNCINLSPDGRVVATASDDAGVRVWDVSRGKKLESFETLAAAAASAAFSPDGRFLAYGDNIGKVGILDIKTKAEKSVDGEHTGAVRAVCFSPDGLRLASGGRDQSVRIWATSTGAELDRFDCSAPVLSCAFGTGGKRLWVADASTQPTIYSFDTSSGRTG